MQTIVLAAGVFDFFHEGHRNYLQQAKRLGNRLIVVIARDNTVQRIKGFLPTHNENKRLRQVVASDLADQVILGNSKDLLKTVKQIKPQIIALGYDQKLPIEIEDIEIVRLKAKQPEKFKSSYFR